MLKRRAVSPTPSHEDLFIQRYRWLLESALRLTNRNHEQAEDLVHDVFIHFTLDRPDLDRVQNLDGYLYAMLRNMYVSQLRRTARVRVTSISPSELSIADYDFIAEGLQAVEQRAQQVQLELRHICQYACARKQTSKAGAVLVLRFFHGYYPGEIAKVLHSPRASADKWLQIARSEVKLYLSDPNALGFIGKGPADLSISDSALTMEDFVNELREVIFKQQGDECFTREQLQELYGAKHSGSVECHALGHIVSCRHCLDEVNTLLALPLLSDRYPTKTLSPDKRKPDKGDGSGPGGTSGDSGGDDFLSRSRRRRKKVIEHHPQQLRISVNGFILGSQDVAAELNKQTISVKGEEKIGFVEIFSEQEVRLLFANIEPPPDGPIEHRKRVELSDSRSLELTLDFSESWPNVHVVYHDPTLSASESRVASLESEFSEERRVKGSEARVDPKKTLWPQCRAWFYSIRQALDFGVFFRPSTVTAIFAGLLIAALIFIQLRRPPSLSATELLQQSILAEETAASRPDQVMHRTITLEARKVGQPSSQSSAGELIARLKIEAWHSADKGITARRVYDERGTLLSGDWRRSDGVQTLYHHGSRPQVQLVPDKRTTSPVTFENAWQLDTSAKDFSRLIGDPQKASIAEGPASYVISYTEREGGTSGLVRASLVLSRSDLHATELTLLVRNSEKNTQSGIGDLQFVEYHFAETSFERRPLNAVAPAVFEPESILLSSSEADTRNSKLETSTPASSVQPLIPVIATADLEVEVMRLLHEANADLGEQISVGRTSDGVLKVQGLVDTEQRKTEILKALAPVTRNPAVKIDVSTFSEAVARQKRETRSPAAPIAAERVETNTDVFPAYADLRRQFSDEESRRFATRMVHESHQTMRHAWALKRLMQQFSAEDLRTLTRESRAKWLDLIRAHAAAFSRDTAQLRQELAPVFFSAGANVDSAPTTGVASDADLLRAVERLIEVASANDQAISTAFSISTESTGTSTLKTAQFFRSLKSAESLAQEIARAAE
jgi:RNA polymerase sigma factor (sigma-70 family)